MDHSFHHHDLLASADPRRRDRPPAAELAIMTFGRTHVEARGRSLDGQWLGQRAGQLLKYLVCRRDTVASADEIAEAIWPGKGLRAIGNTRHVVHRLRHTLEPLRLPRAHSSFVVALGGGYLLDRERVWLDVDEFERAVRRGAAAVADGDMDAASRELEHAIGLYRAEFLGDEPYADWAFEERSRLGGQARYALRVLVALARERDDRVTACRHLTRLADLEPLDSDVCQDLLLALLRNGQRSEAKRRFLCFANRLRREFGEEPDFDLRSLAADTPARLNLRATADSPSVR